MFVIDFLIFIIIKLLVALHGLYLPLRNSSVMHSRYYVDRCRGEITDRLHQLRDVVSKHASITASLKQISSMLDDVASNCQQLSVDIGPSQEDAAALLSVSQVCITTNLPCCSLLVYCLPPSLWLFFTSVPLGFVLSVVPEENLFEAGCPSCHPANSVKALKETQSTNSSQWPGLILSLFAARLLMEGHCFLNTNSLVPLPGLVNFFYY